MDALMLALLLGLALDLGEGVQRLVRGQDAQAVVPLAAIIALGAIVSSLIGLALAPYLAGAAGLLFFALGLMLGAASLVLPARTAPPLSGIAGYGRLALHRLTGASAFLFVGIAAMTGQGWATALGGMLGSLVALLPLPLFGPAYERAVPLRLIRPVLGASLALAGFVCALRALGLL